MKSKSKTVRAGKRSHRAKSARGRSVQRATALLRQGSQGAAVTTLQEQLNAAGFGPITVDGNFGPRTDDAVRRFQAEQGLTVDGVVGPATARALAEAVPTVAVIPRAQIHDLDAALRAEYDRLWSTCEILPATLGEVDSTVDRLRAQQKRYQSVSDITGVPWYMIAVIHQMEADGKFTEHLHNGDPLTAKTVHVPAGLPPGNPPFSWEESAVDALQHDHLVGWSDWSPSGICWKLERYNGLGYRSQNPPATSAYLWSYTNQHARGKYVADGVYDPDAPMKRPGAVALLKAMESKAYISIDAARSRSRGPRGGRAPMTGETLAGLPYPGQIVRPGSSNVALVRQIQQRLNEVGCGPLVTDGIFGRGTTSAVKQFQVTHADLDGHSLDVEGLIGPTTWVALFGTPSLATSTAAADDSFVGRVLAFATTQVNVMERPQHDNRGTEVDEYLRVVGVASGRPTLQGVAWCAAFVYYCFNHVALELGVSNPIYPTAGCMEHWRHAEERGARVIHAAQAMEDPRLVQPGHIFIIQHDDGGGHTGLVESVSGGKLQTIEGNTNPGGSREGYGVFKRSRDFREVNMGFLDYLHLLPSVASQSDRQRTIRRGGRPSRAPRMTKPEEERGWPKALDNVPPSGTRSTD